MGHGCEGGDGSGAGTAAATGNRRWRGAGQAC